MPPKANKGNSTPNKETSSPKQRASSPIIDSKTLQRMITTLQNENVGDVLIDPSDTGSVLQHLATAFCIVTDMLEMMKEKLKISGSEVGEKVTEEVKSKVNILEERLRTQEDECDEIKQRSLKGNLILSSPSIPAKNIKSLIKTDEVLAQENKSVLEHSLDLIHSKYGVRVPIQDIQALHKLPNSTILIRIWNRKEGSAWSHLINAIKTGENRSVNIYLNFQLTQRRSNLVYHLRQFKKTSMIAKFYTDENGAISLKVKDKDSKLKITYYKKRDSVSAEKTLTKEELTRLIQARK